MRYILGLCIAMCAAVTAQAQQTHPRDPFENSWNRPVTEFNMVVDDNVLKPVARTYRAVLPTPVRTHVGNAVSNLDEPLNFINSVLQGNVEHAGTALTRFMINSTFGLGGLFDVAGYEGVAQKPEDFGQTLAVWGWDESPYLVLPLLGPNTAASSVGIAVDAAANPVPYVFDDWNAEGLNVAVPVVEVIDTRANLLDTTDSLEKNSLDYYAAVRSFYLQNRQKLIHNQQDSDYGDYAVD